MNNVSDFVKMIADNNGIKLTDAQLKELTDQLLRDKHYRAAHEKLVSKMKYINKKKPTY